MTPEARLLLLLARGEPGPAEGAEARALLARPVDWASVVRLARHHEVVPLLHRSLQRLGVTGVPPDARDALDAGRLAAAARSGLLARELTGVLRLLEAAGLPAMPMKGVSLAETLYGDPGLRECSDIDVLVPRDRAREALRLLRAHGYATEFSERFFEALLLRADIEYTLCRREHGFDYLLDLHWAFGWSPQNDRRAAAALWAESRRVTRSGVGMHVMSHEWELLTLAVHAARHAWQSLKWLVDVHDYCTVHVLDWEKVRRTAERFGWLPALEQTFGACRVLLGTPAPPGLARVPPARLPALDIQAGTSAARPRLPLRLIGSHAERARFLLRQAMIPTLAERRLVRLPSSLSLFYYPMRPVRLGAKWGRRLLQGGSYFGSR